MGLEWIGPWSVGPFDQSKRDSPKALLGDIEVAVSLKYR